MLNNKFALRALRYKLLQKFSSRRKYHCSGICSLFTHADKISNLIVKKQTIYN